MNTNGTASKAQEIHRFRSFNDYYRDSERHHRNIVNRRLHFIGAGTSIVIALMSTCAGFLPGYAVAAAVAYGCAWVGHRLIEKNHPPKSSNPFHSIGAYYRQLWDVLNDRIVL